MSVFKCSTFPFGIWRACVFVSMCAPYVISFDVYNNIGGYALNNVRVLFSNWFASRLSVVLDTLVVIKNKLLNSQIPLNYDEFLSRNEHCSFIVIIAQARKK